MNNELSSATAADHPMSEESANVGQSTAGAVEQLNRFQHLHETLAQNFQEVVIGTLNRHMQFSLIAGNGAVMTNVIDSGFRHAQDHVYHFPQLQGDTLPILRTAFYGTSVTHETEVDGQHYKIKAIPVKDPGKPIEEVLCVFQNVTSQKKMEEGLLAALDREKELGELKSRFVTMASHEFRTPLTAILASTFLLENHSGEDYNKEKVVHTSRIKRSVNNLTNILNEFLSLEKLEANKVSVVRSDINVPEYIQDDLLGEMELIKKPNQTIVYNHTGKALLNADHQMLWSILTNLISNALKYSTSGATVTVSSDIDDSRLLITVTDNGIGIPPDEHKNIFGRFYRARNATNIEGTGLGLHITQKYVQLLNGTIEFQSHLDEGTTFTVNIPDGHGQALNENPLTESFK